MLCKLALRNAKRSVKDYLVYLVTVAIAFTLIFSFNIVAFSEEVLRLSAQMENFRGAVIFVSVLVVFVLGWLIGYVENFSFLRRGREFGTYMLLGVEKRRIARMVALENLVMQAAALIVGLVAGLYFSQLITALVLHVFDAPYELKFSVSGWAVLLTFAYFALLYGLCLLKTFLRFKKATVKRFLYQDRINQKPVSRSSALYAVAAVLSLGAIAGGIVLAYSGIQVGVNASMANLFFGVAVMIVGIYGACFSAPHLLSLLLKSRRFRNHDTNCVLVRTLTAKIRTVGMVFGTLCLLMTLSLGAASVGATLNGTLNFMADRAAPSDFTFMSPDAEDDFAEFTGFVRGRYDVEREYGYRAYADGDNASLSKKLFATQYRSHEDILIGLTAYNGLMDFLGGKRLSLSEGEFAVNSRMTGVEREILACGAEELTYFGRTLRFKEARADAMAFFTHAFFIIVPDSVVEGRVPVRSFFAMDTVQSSTEQDYLDLCGLVDTGELPGGIVIASPSLNLSVRGSVVAENRSLFLILTFSISYVAAVFALAAFTVLAVQQLSDAEKFKHRYRLLRRLGLSAGGLNKLIVKQLLLFFAVPAVIAIAAAAGIALAAGAAFSVYLTGLWEAVVPFLGALGVFTVLWLCYFCATLVGFKRSVKMK